MKSQFFARLTIGPALVLGLALISACSGASTGGPSADKPGGSSPNGGPGRSGGQSGPQGGSGGAGGRNGEAVTDAGAGSGSGGSGSARADARAPMSDARSGPPSATPAATAPTPNPVAGPAGPWARGVRVGLVEVTQGVFIKIGEGTTVVAPAMRNSVLIEGRPLFARVHVATDAGFAARKLRTVLSLGGADGSKFEIEDTKMISGSSNVEQLETTFNFLVPADKVRPTTAMVASIYETAPTSDADPMLLPRFPADGGADLGVKAGKMELDIVFVPDGTLIDTPERRKKLEQDVWDLYPVQKVNFTYHEPVPLVGALTRSQAFAILRDTREKDGAKPHQYYHYLTSASGAGFTGSSSVAGPTVASASRRVSVTTLRNKAIDGNTDTVAHETGHASGLSHMPGCGASGPDQTYPYTMFAGDMGVNGYSLSFNAFKSRMKFREMMSYCHPRWVSDFIWNKFETRIRIVTGFADAPGAMTQMLSSHSLQGFAGPGEAPNWGIVAGTLVEETATITADRYALLTLADGRQVKVAVTVTLASDDETRELAVNLDGADHSDGDVVQAEIFANGQRSVVPVSTMFRHR